MVLASPGTAVSRQAIDRAAELAAGGTVAVVTIARVHGSGLGLPHPGLLPSARERREQLALVERAITRLRGAGVEADGQVVVTRKAARAITRIATVRSAQAIVMDAAAGGRLRRLVEGDASRAVSRRFPGRVEVIPSACRQAR